VSRSDTAGQLRSGKVTCAARIRSRRLAALAKGFRRGRATCVWKIPRRARGTLLTGSITVVYQGASVQRRFRFRVR
jgi:hypothetical protein